jgi:NifU-like protein involved in Fe-S cluster formation
MVATAPSQLSQKATTRLRKPKTRGTFQPIDAARRQLGLLAVADGQGQARLFWLIDLGTQVIEDARFLAFGTLASHPLMDAFTEMVRGRTVADACALLADQVESLLRDDPLTPACNPADITFIHDLQQRALAELPSVQLLPKPVEKVSYQRKRKQDWTSLDEAWLPLSLLKKIGTVDSLIQAALPPGASLSIDGLHDDFRIIATFAGLAPEQIPTLCQQLTDLLRGRIHPDIRVEAP